MTPVLDYHQNTKHSFNRFARSLGYLDWAAQPDPFRRYDGASRIELPRRVLRPDIPYAALFDGSAPAAPVNASSIGEFLRCSMGLSAWKQYQANRWALRINPSSGNLHPTECYIVWNGRVCHYAPREHALEVRAEWDVSPSGPAGSRLGSGLRARAHDSEDTFVVGLTSILWREAWKYGERAFRYCQHDVGHAIGALRFAAAMLGWHLRLVEGCPDDQVAALLGLDRDHDYADAEREEPECLLLMSAAADGRAVDLELLARTAASSVWAGRANVLSGAQVEWSAIDEVARGTRKMGAAGGQGAAGGREGDREPGEKAGAGSDAEPPAVSPVPCPPPPGLTARQVILQRRSALGFDARSSVPRDVFFSMLQRLNPVAPPWDAIGWAPQVHLALFVHRVDGLLPGLYVYVRHAAAVDELRRALRSDFLWERVNANAPNDPNDPNALNLFLLVPTDVRFAADRLSCDQAIAADGFFSLGMIARLEDSLRERGDWFYRRLFWECGLIGQVLYLEAEAAGGRATGIGCFYDDPVHEILGLSGMTWQSLYHFSMGVPVDDGRLTTEGGYPGGW